MSDALPPSSPITCLDIELHPRVERFLHTHDDHEFFLCMRGTGAQDTDRATLAMKPGDLFLFPEGVPHVCKPALDEPVRGLVVNVHEQIFAPSSPGDRESARVLARLCDVAVSQGSLIRLSSPSARRVRVLLADLVREYNHKAVGYRSAVKARLQEVLLVLLRDPVIGTELERDFSPPHVEERVRDVLRYLESSYHEPVSVARMARLAHLSRSHFHAVFRRETGRTLTRFVNELRVDAANRLLTTSELPIIEIAARVGFPCMSHFYAVFRQLTGASPAKVRRVQVEEAAS
jgi:AraC-like DNA-binding protein/uncharacterized RmlC-like cupin family protein